jgi:hypothetical protein
MTIIQSKLHDLALALCEEDFRYKFPEDAAAFEKAMENVFIQYPQEFVERYNEKLTEILNERGYASIYQRIVTNVMETIHKQRAEENLSLYTLGRKAFRKFNSKSPKLLQTAN